MTPDDSRQKFQNLSLVRLAGITLMIVGFLLWRTDLLGVTAPQIGAVCVVLGAVLVMVLASWLRQRRAEGRLRSELLKLAHAVRVLEMAQERAILQRLKQRPGAGDDQVAAVPKLAAVPT